MINIKRKLKILIFNEENLFKIHPIFNSNKELKSFAEQNLINFPKLLKLINYENYKSNLNKILKLKNFIYFNAKNIIKISNEKIKQNYFKIIKNIKNYTCIPNINLFLKMNNILAQILFLYLIKRLEFNKSERNIIWMNYLVISIFLIEIPKSQLEKMLLRLFYIKKNYKKIELLNISIVLLIEKLDN